MKRIISIVLMAALCLTMLGSCAKKSDARPFDYDLSKHITLGEYVGMEYTFSVPEVTEQAVAEYINKALSEKGYGEQKEITDRAAQNGDTVNIDFEGKINGTAFEGGTSKGYDLVLGSNSFIEGFEAGLVGVKAGETVDLNLKFPENYGKEDLNGKDVVFTVKVNKITATVYPELTDEIVSELSDKKTVDEYMTYANEQVKSSNEAAALNEKESSIWAKVVENVKVNSLPEDEIENYKKLIIETYDEMAQQQYGMSYQDYLSQATGQSLEDIDDVLTQQAEGAVKEYMTIVAIAREQNLELTEEQYQEELAKYAKNNGYSTTEEFKAAINESQFYLSLLIEKVMDFVVENAVEVKGA